MLSLRLRNDGCLHVFLATQKLSFHLTLCFPQVYEFSAMVSTSR